MSDTGTPRVKRPSLHEEIVAEVRRMIVDGELAPGEWIAEMQLCGDLGISRTPLREALKVLASEELVLLEQNRGTRVAPITFDAMLAQFEFMEALQMFAGRLAAERASEDELERLNAMHREMIRLHETGDRSAYFSLNQEVHTLIASAARNPPLFSVHEASAGKIRRARYQANLSYDRWAESLQEHGEFVAALTARDGQRAGELLSDHLRRTGIAVCSALKAFEDAGERAPDDRKGRAR
ncbi:GntR family transcriptional regulator [Acuticoccus sediminis]|uniref:GntR family transcriptional regulator n=1 Tax=Acuticoccus sediminis TaxID=2184697 RepID=UPI001CFD57D9|nr:GntR family transcriptional regulator [Acuticoccus sediminis]